MPESMKDERTQEYGIAIRQDAIDLRRTIDSSVARAKQDGSLARVYKEASEEFEDTFAPRQPQLGSPSLAMFRK